MGRRLVLVLVLLALVRAEGLVEKLQPVPGIKLGAVEYYRSLTRPDASLEKAISRDFQLRPGEKARYQYNLVELSSGGPQALVYLFSPRFSGSGGSTAAIFQKQGEDWRLVTRMTLMRNPIVKAETSTHGWHDLIVRISGGGMPARFVRLRYDGQSYPTNPTALDPMPKGSVVQGTAYVSTPLSPRSGLELVVPAR